MSLWCRKFLSKGPRHVARILFLVAGIFGAVPVAYGQVGAGGSLPGTSFGGITDPTNVQRQKGWKIVPGITAAERYDSNVFFVPQDQAPGLELADYVTTLSPQVKVNYGGSLMKGNASVAAVGEYYVVNPALSYVGANAALSLDLSPALERVLPKAKLDVSESFTYTPQPPAFLAGNLEADTTNPFLKGIQVGRINNTSNVVSATGSVPLSPWISLQASYTNGFLRFGRSSVQQAAFLFDTDYQTISAGLQYAVSPLDTLMVSYLDSKSEFGGGSLGSFSSRGGIVEWKHVYSPTVELKTTAGASLVEGDAGGGAEFGFVSVPPTIAPNGSAALIWKGRDTNVTFLYSLAVTPSYFFTNEPMLSHGVSIAATRTVDPSLSLFAGADYGRSAVLGGAIPFSYTSYGASLGLNYRITSKTFASASYAYSNFDYQFGLLPFKFDRHVMSVSIATAWY